MAVSFRIFPERGLVFVRYEGTARVTDTSAVFAQYMQHPHFRPGQKQLVDLGGLSDMDADFPELMKLQAHKADAFLAGLSETLVVYHAPTELTLKMARFVERSWDDVPGVVPIVVQHEEEALSLLGMQERSFGELLARAS